MQISSARRKDKKVDMVDAEWVLVNIVGNTGVALILIAYFALTLQKLQSESIIYSVLNLIGAVLIGVSLIFNFNLPSAVIEVSWGVISLVGLTKALIRRFRTKQRQLDSAATQSTELPAASPTNALSIDNNADPHQQKRRAQQSLDLGAG